MTGKTVKKLVMFLCMASMLLCTGITPGFAAKTGPAATPNSSAAAPLEAKQALILNPKPSNILHPLLPIKPSTPPLPNTAAKPIPERTTVVSVIQGTLKVSNIEGKHFELVSNDTLYVLTGRIEGIEKYVGQPITAKGIAKPDAVSIYQRGIIFEVQSYELTSVPSSLPATPMPTPEIVLLKGTLTVIKPVSNDDDNIQSPYQFRLESDQGPYTLEGETSGLEKYDGMKIEVKGYYTYLKIYPPVFKVLSYRLITDPAPVPEYDTIEGTLKVLKPEPEDYDSAGSGLYKYQLDTKNGLYELIGNTKGLENYNNAYIIVLGHYVMTLMDNSFAPTYPPLFNVVSYKVISEPEPEPVPSTSYVHSILSDKPLYFSSPDTGSIGLVDAVSGNCSISWSENTYRAFFNAKLVVALKDTKALYEFELVSAKTSDRNSITGVFNIKKDGQLVEKEIPGMVYGLTEPVGSYFKFYSDDSAWHMSSYITNRMDF